VSAALVAVTVTVCVEVMLEGAVYRPAVEMAPTLGASDQVTAVFVVPLTVAVNCCVWELDKVALAGLTDTETPPAGGLSVTAAVPVFVVSAALVAVTVTVCVEVMLEGAVYRPAVDIVPTFGVSDQVTAVFVVPLTVAVNCRVWELVKVALAGLTDTETPPAGGLSVTVAVPVFVVSAALVAVTVTVCVEVMLEGAVYRPAAEIVPTFGVSDHVTAVFVVPVTVAVNCCVWELDRVAVAGLTDTPTVPPPDADTIWMALILGFSTTGTNWIVICPEEVTA
jgi:hypothetical protein